MPDVRRRSPLLYFSLAGRDRTGINSSATPCHPQFSSDCERVHIDNMIKNTSSAQLRLNGHSYYKKNTANGNVYWRCTLFRGGQCGATAITRQTPDGLKIVKEGVHGHPGSDDASMEMESDEPVEGSEHSLAEDDPDEQSDDEQSDDSAETESEREEKEWQIWEEDTDVEEEEEMESQTMENEYEDALESDDETDEDDSEVDSFSLLMDRLKLHKRELKNLCTESGTLREAVLKEGDKTLICFLCEISWNLLNGYFELKVHEKNLLRLIKDDIRVIANDEFTWVQKKEALVEHAHDLIIPILLNVVLPHLT